MDNTSYYNELLLDKFSDISLSSFIFIIFGGAIGVIGNALVIYFYLFRIKERGERYFIPLLALVDLLGCVISPAYFTLRMLSSTACRILYFLQICFPGLSGHTLLLISIQRYILVCRPFGPRMTLFWKRVSFGMACFVSVAYSLPLLITAGLYEKTLISTNQSVTTFNCKYAINQTPSKTAYFYLLCGIMLVNIILTVGFYIPVLKRIILSLRFVAKKYEVQKESNNETNEISMQKSVTDKGNSEFEQTKNSYQIHAQRKTKTVSSSPKRVRLENVEELHDKEETISTVDRTPEDWKPTKKTQKVYKTARTQRRITIMVLCLIVVYVLSYIPPLVMMNINSNVEASSYVTMTRLEYAVRTYMGRLVILNHIVNPLIYAFFDTKFREEIRHPCQNKKQ